MTNKPKTPQEQPTDASACSAGLEEKAAAFDALVEMLEGKHRERLPALARPRANGRGGFTVHLVHTYVWEIAMESSTDIRAGLLKMLDPR